MVLALVFAIVKFSLLLWQLNITFIVYRIVAPWEIYLMSTHSHGRLSTC